MEYNETLYTLKEDCGFNNQIERKVIEYTAICRNFAL
jgi:hypothetical protein